MTEGGSSGNAGEPTTGLAYLRAYLTLFVAHWFGARRFDKVGHQEGYNPEDVKAYCDAEQKSEHLRRNFTRSRSVLVTAQAEVSGTVEANGSAAVEAERPAQDAEAQGADAGVGDLADINVEEGAEAGQSGPGGSHTSHVQIESSKQMRPWFVACQCLAILLLYMSFGLRKYKKDKMTGVDPWLAGLDSVSRGSTDLRWSGPHCEDLRPESWRWLTYQWTHVGVVHVLTNTVMLFFLGIPLEGHEGSFRTCLIFNVGVVAGALCFFLCEAHGYVVGCSGGIYALMGVHISDLVMNWKERHFRKWSMLLLIFFLSTDVLTWGIVEDLSDGNYSYSAALGGSSAGLILGALIGKNFTITTKDGCYMAVLGTIGVGLVMFSLAWLGLNEAPLNIWEAAAGDSGYCWVKQFFNPALNATNYQCIRCKTEECVAEWSLQPELRSVKFSACASQGWFYDER